MINRNNIYELREKYRAKPNQAANLLQQGRERRGLASRTIENFDYDVSRAKASVKEIAKESKEESRDTMEEWFEPVTNQVVDLIDPSDDDLSSSGSDVIMGGAGDEFLAGGQNFDNVEILSGFTNANLTGTRTLPLSESYQRTVSGIVSSLGEGWDVRVISGGQVQRGQPGPRTGSTRHDVDDTGHAHTSDFVLTYEGREVRPGDNPEIYEKFFERAAPYFPGMGHYEWGIHVGGGSPAFWGPDTTSATADRRFAAAYRRGRENMNTQGAPRGEIQRARYAIGTIESSNNYSARGRIMESGSYRGDRAYGRYQVMGRNIGPWSREALGREVSISEFLANPSIQDRIFDYHFGRNMERYGFQDAASIWFSGRRMQDAGNASDGNIDVPEYVRRATREYRT